MAVEIKELVIRAVVDPEPTGSSGTGSPGEETLDPRALGVDQQQWLVEQCTREVLRILRRSRER